MPSPPPDLSGFTSVQKDALIGQLFEQIALLQSQVRELQARLGMNSRDSSKPPSSDGYDKPAPKSRRDKSGKKSGGQPGHKGRTLERRAHPDRVIDHRLERCEGCGTDLGSAAVLGTEARQVIDLPPIKAEVTEHRVPIKRCPCCRARCRGAFPPGVARAVQYGPGVQAAASYLSGYQLLPYARLTELFTDLFGLSLSQGTIERFLERGHGHLEPFETGARAEIIAAAVAHFDESGVRVGGELHWLHVASTESVTSYAVHPGRGAEAMKAMGILEPFDGYAVHDHWSSYFTFEGQLHVLCNAHHLRELVHAHEQHGQRWAGKLIECLSEAKREVDAARAGGARRLEDKRIDYYERRYRRILREGIAELPVLPPEPGRTRRHKAANLHERLRAFMPEVLAFVYDLALPFDNNLAERDVRMVKVKQKISGCFRSDRGAERFARLRGYISTARKQGRGVLGALRDAFEGRPFDPSGTRAATAG